MNNRKRVEKLINEISELDLNGEERYRRLLTLTDFALYAGDWARARQLLASEDWGRGTKNYTADRRYYWNLYSGIYFSKIKNRGVSESHFKSAYVEGLSYFGDKDFRVGMVYLLKYLVSGELRPAGEKQLASKYLGLMSNAYADSHATLREIRRGLNEKSVSPNKPVEMNFDLIT